MKVKRRRSPKIIKEKYVRIATDYNGGIKVKDIARRNKCSVQTVYNALKKVIEY